MKTNETQKPVWLLFMGRKSMTIESAVNAAQCEVESVAADGRWHWQSDRASPDVISLRGQPEEFRRVLDDCHAWQRRVFINDVANKAEQIAEGLPSDARGSLLRAAEGLRGAEQESGVAVKNLRECLSGVLRLLAAQIADAVFAADGMQVAATLREIDLLFCALSDNTHLSDFCDLRFDNPEYDVITAIPGYAQVAEDAASYCSERGDYYLAKIVVNGA